MGELKKFPGVQMIVSYPVLNPTGFPPCPLIHDQRGPTWTPLAIISLRTACSADLDEITRSRRWHVSVRPARKEDVTSYLFCVPRCL